MQFFKPNGYDTAEVLPESGGRARLPKGGYVCKILTVEPMESRNGNPYLLFNLDIAEGEYMGHFADDYASQTGDKKWHFTHRLMIPTDNAKPFTLNLFKTFNKYVEESNPGWHFNFDGDEKQYRGQLIGVLVNEVEYERSNGKRAMKTNIARVVKANTVRSGAYTVPNDVLLPPVNKSEADYYAVDSVDDDDLPFN